MQIITIIDIQNSQNHTWFSTIIILVYVTYLREGNVFYTFETCKIQLKLYHNTHAQDK